MKQKSERQRIRQQRARRKQITIITAIAAISVLAVILLIALTGKSSAQGEIKTAAARQWPIAEGKVLGAADASVVVMEFADFQCPYCRLYHEQVFSNVINDYVASGLVRYEFHHLIVIDGNIGSTESRQAAEASQCAAEQNRFWDYFDTLYANQQSEGSGTFSNTRLKQMAEVIGLDTAEFNRCLGSLRPAGEVGTDERLAASYGLSSTPSLLVNGVKVENALDYRQVQAAIDAALGQ